MWIKKTSADLQNWVRYVLFYLIFLGRVFWRTATVAVAAEDGVRTYEVTGASDFDGKNDSIRFRITARTQSGEFAGVVRNGGSSFHETLSCCYKNCSVTERDYATQSFEGRNSIEKLSISRNEQSVKKNVSRIGGANVNEMVGGVLWPGQQYMKTRKPLTTVENTITDGIQISDNNLTVGLLSVQSYSVENRNKTVNFWMKSSHANELNNAVHQNSGDGKKRGTPQLPSRFLRTNLVFLEENAVKYRQVDTDWHYLINHNILKFIKRYVSSQVETGNNFSKLLTIFFSVIEAVLPHSKCDKFRSVDRVEHGFAEEHTWGIIDLVKLFAMEIACNFTPTKQSSFMKVIPDKSLTVNNIRNFLSLVRKVHAQILPGWIKKGHKNAMADRSSHFLHPRMKRFLPWFDFDEILERSGGSTTTDVLIIEEDDQSKDLKYLYPLKVGLVILTYGLIGLLTCAIYLMPLEGTKGIKGEKGWNGWKGYRGVLGDYGQNGMRGDMGLAGFKGQKGWAGWNGLRGLKGDEGDYGISGMRGEKGKKGEQGLKGYPGVTVNGDVGEKGFKGAEGPKGFPGFLMDIAGQEKHQKYDPYGDNDYSEEHDNYRFGQHRHGGHHKRHKHGGSHQKHHRYGSKHHDQKRGRGREEEKEKEEKEEMEEEAKEYEEKVGKGKKERKDEREEE
ncbi:Collagen triple helix repeat [Trinorchestia longiramus]|nr:Collagen triple helix repeat [Trinorchestia longiramus]